MVRLGIGAAVGLALVLTLAGCSGPVFVSGHADDTGTPSVSDLVVAPSGLGALKIGSPVTASELVVFGKHACPTSGGWVPRFVKDDDNSSGQPLSPFDVDTLRASRTTAITSIFVWNRTIMTAKRIHVGSSLADVLAAYPTATLTREYSTVLYAVPGTTGQLVIELAGHNDDAEGEWPAKQLDTVVWMYVIAASAKPVSLAGSDDAGPCPVVGHVPAVGGDD